MEIAVDVSFGSEQEQLGRESEALGEWAGAAVSLAQYAPPPAACEAMQSASSSRSRNSLHAPALSRRDITRPVTFYQATSTAKEVSSYNIYPPTSRTHAFSLYSSLSLNGSKLKVVFPFVVGMWENGFRCPYSLFQ